VWLLGEEGRFFLFPSPHHHFFSLVGVLLAFSFHLCPLTQCFFTTFSRPPLHCPRLLASISVQLPTTRHSLLAILQPYNLDLLWFVDGFSLKPDILSSCQPRSSRNCPPSSSAAFVSFKRYLQVRQVICNIPFASARSNT
jgi:hypothetical protein